MLSISKCDLRLLAGFLTARAVLKYYLYKFEEIKDKVCRLCQEDLETFALIHWMNYVALNIAKLQPCRLYLSLLQDDEKLADGPIPSRVRVRYLLLTYILLTKPKRCRGLSA